MSVPDMSLGHGMQGQGSMSLNQQQRVRLERLQPAALLMLMVIGIHYGSLVTTQTWQDLLVRVVRALEQKFIHCARHIDYLANPVSGWEL